MPLPAGLQNSHQNGGRVFLIFVADPRTIRLCMNREHVFSVDSTAINALRTASSAAASLRASSWGSVSAVPPGGMAHNQAQGDVAADRGVDGPQGRAHRCPRTVDADDD